MEDPQNPYAAPSAPPPLPSEYGWDESVKADRGIRLVARLIDGGLQLACVVPFFISMIISPSLRNDEFTSGHWIGMAISGVLLLILLVYQLVLLSQTSQTLGKRWMSIKIVRNDGSPVSFGRVLGLRMVVITLIEQVPCVGPVFGLVNVLWIFGEESRCLHDLMADTKVVNV